MAPLKPIDEGGTRRAGNGPGTLTRTGVQPGFDGSEAFRQYGW